MKSKDFLWIGALLAIIVFLVYPETHKAFMYANKVQPYLMGFVKVSILATLGELLAIRIVAGDWKKPHGLIYRFIVWGLFGVSFVIVFDIFANGVAGSMNNGLLFSLPAEAPLSRLVFAFFTSAFMNLIFAPTFMALHRVTDMYIDLGQGQLKSILKVNLKDVASKIDWHGFLSFVVVKTIPFFWIPAHTVTFLLPAQYRVLMASFLSIALGGILAFAKRRAAKVV